MKTSGHGHPKFRRLKTILGIREYEAVGILEVVWHFTACHAPRGDIGRWEDEDIMAAVEWDPAAGDLVAALVESRFLDVSEEHRFVVHDWHDHAQDGLRGRLESRGDTWATNGEPVFRTERARAEWIKAGGKTGENRGEPGRKQSNPATSGKTRGSTGKSKKSPEPTEDFKGVEAAIAWWNGMKAEGIVSVGVQAKPTEALRTAWKAALSDPERKYLVTDFPAIETEIRKSPFCNQPWFDLIKLLNGRNKERQFIITKLLNGGFRDGKRNSGGAAPSYRPEDYESF